MYAAQTNQVGVRSHRARNFRRFAPLGGRRNCVPLTRQRHVERAAQVGPGDDADGV
jgi:hypothetical protein